jgi:protein-disulfide isomerase-like protein with CxxC motif
LPAFHAAKAAARQGEQAFEAYDLRVRRAFFADSANIGKPAVLVDLARELGLDLARFEADMASAEVQAQVLSERSLGTEQFGVRGTPTMILPDRSRAQLPVAMPRMRNRRTFAVPPLPCCGDGCLDAMRQLLEQAATMPPSSV